MTAIDDLETLYRRHAPALLRFALGLSGDPALAEDIVSETFVRVLTRAPKIETRTAFAYLLAIARHIFVDGVRRRRRDVPLSAEIATAEDAPEERLDHRMLLATALRALSDIPEGERAAFLLRVDHELPYEEIGAALGISAVAARVRVHRARVRLAAASAPKGERP